MSSVDPKWEEHATVVRKGLMTKSATDEVIEAVFALTDLKEMESLTKEESELLEAAWGLVDGKDAYMPGEKANLDVLDFESVQGALEFTDEIPNLPALGDVPSVNFHAALETGRVLEERASVWRCPDSLGAVLSAARMLEMSVRERQLKGQLEATHPEPSILSGARALDLDNAEVAQSTKMLELALDRNSAQDRQAEAERALEEEKASSQKLLGRIAELEQKAVQQAGMHDESYTDLKLMFKKLVVERNETNRRQGQAMLEAQTALEHLVTDKSELLAEVDSLYNQLAAMSGSKQPTRAEHAAALEADNLRSVRQLARKKEDALREECAQLKEALRAEEEAGRQRASEAAAGLERYRSETGAKIRLLEESLRLQDESALVAEEARNQIRREIQSKFDKQLRALLSEVEESEARSKDVADKFRQLQENMGKDSDEMKKLKKENERLVVENEAMRARELKRRAKEEKMQELAATLVKEATANDNLAARLKATQAKLDEFTRRGLVATTADALEGEEKNGSRSMGMGGASGEGGGGGCAGVGTAAAGAAAGVGRRLPLPAYSGGGGARSAEFNAEVQKKLDGLTLDSKLGPYNQGSVFAPRANGSGSLGGSLKELPPGPTGLGKAKSGLKASQTQVI